MALTRTNSGVAGSKGEGIPQAPDSKSTLHEISADPVDEAGGKRWSRRSTWALVGGLALAFWLFVGWLVVSHWR